MFLRYLLVNKQLSTLSLRNNETLHIRHRTRLDRNSATFIARRQLCMPMNVYSSVARIGIRSTIAAKPQRSVTPVIRTMVAIPNGDLNNTSAERVRAETAIDPAYQDLSLAIPPSEDDFDIRKAYRPFILEEEEARQDWIAQLELSTVLKMVDTQVLKPGDDRLRVVVLHGSMRQR
jgi:arsenic resistance protein ArsH